MKGKKLYRSESNRMLCGVCAGIAEYFDIDPTLVRLGWVLLSFLGFSGIIAYVIAAIIIPTQSTLQ
ncbi:MAG: PspC domain-containing protein [Agathobaculum sp.]|jgi:phage shock protein C|uniref:PspC domain-containing protein n=1 Tax=Agathobaculum sp. TaxID=2048138 RepID=UPI003D94125F